MANLYDDHLIIKDALQLYFSRYHFKDGGYHLKWFEIKLGPVYVPLPNIPARVRAVKIHDIHHVITEYKANLKGEAQIGAWEIASGCGRYYAAWLLNFASFSYGIFFFPKPVMQAFLDGRKCATNFYHNTRYDEHLLRKTVGELRDEAGIAGRKPNAVQDYLLFAFCCCLVIGGALLFISALVLLLKRAVHYMTGI